MKLERLKLVTVYFIQSLHVSLVGYKPFNPIIGETFQAIITPPEKEKNDKAPNNSNINEKEQINGNEEGNPPIHFYVEQTSHHPPIASFYGKSKNFVCYGCRESSAIGSGNSVVSHIKGPFNIKFSDGTHIVATFPKFMMHGLVFGKKTFCYDGNLIVEDKTNGLLSITDIMPKESKGFLSKMFYKSTKNFPDYFRGFIAPTSDVTYDKKTDAYTPIEESVLAKIEGEYNMYCNIDNKCYWDINKDSPGCMFKQEFTLPSDSQLRNDIILYKNNKFELAQYAKMTLEDMQRKDVKLRKKFEDSKKKK